MGRKTHNARLQRLKETLLIATKSFNLKCIIISLSKLNQNIPPFKTSCHYFCYFIFEVRVREKFLILIGNIALQDDVTLLSNQCRKVRDNPRAQFCELGGVRSLTCLPQPSPPFIFAHRSVTLLPTNEQHAWSRLLLIASVPFFFFIISGLPRC